MERDTCVLLTVRIPPSKLQARKGSSLKAEVSSQSRCYGRRGDPSTVRILRIVSSPLAYCVTFSYLLSSQQLKKKEKNIHSGAVINACKSVLWQWRHTYWVPHYRTRAVYYNEEIVKNRIYCVFVIKLLNHKCIVIGNKCRRVCVYNFK